MANSNIFAPQAYTREMLSQAFNWLQTQPENIRALASTPENLVALYFKAQRMQSISANQKAQIENTPPSESPVQSQNFLNELRNLADQMSSDVKTKIHTQPQHQTQQQTNTQLQTQIKPNINLQTTHLNMNTQTQHTSNHITMPTKSNIIEAKSTPENPIKAASPLLNSQSLAMIQEVKEKLNLSSDQEAMNMLISIAHKSLKHLLD